MNEGSAGYFTIIMAASYCPVQGPVWDARGGGFFKNVIFEDVRIARFKESGEYLEEDKEELWYGLSTLKYAFTQAADAAHLTFGVHKEDGTYKSGAAYQKGSRYIEFSSYYDGTHIED